MKQYIVDAWEASARGGALQGEVVNEQTLLLRGKAVLFAESQILQL